MQALPPVKTLSLVFLAFLFVIVLSLPTLAQTTEAPAAVFSNTAPITINTAPSTLATPTVATPYPSTIDVSGMTGNTTKVTVTLDGVTHNYLGDLDVLLVSPNGTKVIVLSDALYSYSSVITRDEIFTFDDSAAAFPNFGPIYNGTYGTLNNNDGADTFPAPAPAGPYLNGLSNFNASSPNGTWSLYIVDDSLGNSGALNRGWKLTVTTAGGTQTFSNSNYIEIPDATARATPYPSNISVSGLSGVTSKVTVTLNNFSHQNASDASVLLVSPNGSGIILMSNAGTNANTNNATITFDQATGNNLPFNGSLVTGTYLPSAYSPTDFFPNPAPLSNSTGVFLNSLDGFNSFTPNGTWSLFVLDKVRGNSGMIAGGWSINITTTPFTPTTFGCVLPSFAGVSNYNVGSNPTNLATADFNNDNKPDIVTVNQFSNDISILLNNGTGGFLPATNLAVGSGPYSVAVGKFNADNNFDIAVTNSASNNVSILLGNGNGTFSAPVNFNTGATPISIAVGDFNNDAKQDLAVANFGGFFAGTVSILLGNGTGGFAPQISARVRTQPAFVLVGNFNGDSNQDLAVANFGSDNISILTGQGNGNFTETTAVNTGTGPVSIALNGNAALNAANLITANYNGNTLSYLQNDGSGSFTSNNTQTSGNPISIITSDILTGGSLSAIFARNSTNQINIAGSDFTVGNNPNAVVSADFDGNGQLDAASANSGSNNISVLLNSCSIGRGNLFDFNGDRRTDFAVFRRSSSIWFNQSLPVPSGSQTSIGIPTDQIVPADYNGDGRADIGIFRPESGLWYVPGIYFTFFGQTGDIAAPADFDGDQKADIAVFRPSNGTWYIRRSSDNGFQAMQFGMNGDLPVQGDYDGDGRADIAVFRPSNGVWYWLRSSDGGFSAVQFGQQGDKTVAADYDGDGKTDQAIFRNGIWYILNSSNGQFRSLAFGLGTDIPVPGDYDNDGKFDVAVFRPSNGTWYYLRSVDGAFQGFQYGQIGDVPIPSAYVR